MDDPARVECEERLTAAIGKAARTRDSKGLDQALQDVLVAGLSPTHELARKANVLALELEAEQAAKKDPSSDKEGKQQQQQQQQQQLLQHGQSAKEFQRHNAKSESEIDHGDDAPHCEEVLTLAMAEAEESGDPQVLDLALEDVLMRGFSPSHALVKQANVLALQLEAAQKTSSDSAAKSALGGGGSRAAEEDEEQDSDEQGGGDEHDNSTKVQEKGLVEALRHRSRWTKNEVPDRGTVYWLHRDTKETTGTRPQDYATDEDVDEEEGEHQVAAASLDKPAIVDASSNLHAHQNSRWVKHVLSDRGSAYWLNLDTNETTGTRPDDYESDAADGPSDPQEDFVAAQKNDSNSDLLSSGPAHPASVSPVSGAKRQFVKADSATECRWTKQHIPDRGTVYWLNRDTNETTGVRPDGYLSENDTEARASVQNEAEAGTDASECANPSVGAETSATSSNSRKNHWAKIYDEALAATYYFNIETRESVWERPDGYSSDEDAALPMVADDDDDDDDDDDEEEEEEEGEAVEEKENEVVSASNRWAKTHDSAHNTSYFYHVDTRASVWQRPDGYTTDEDAADHEDGQKKIKPPPAPLNRWAKAFDDKFGKPYWYHVDTTENTWERPDGYTTDEDAGVARPPVQVDPVVDPTPAQSKLVAPDTDEEQSQASMSPLQKLYANQNEEPHVNEESKQEEGHASELTFPSVEYSPYIATSTKQSDDGDDDAGMASLRRNDSVSAIVTRHRMQASVQQWLSQFRSPSIEGKNDSRDEHHNSDSIAAELSFPDIDEHVPHQHSSPSDGGEDTIPGLQRADSVTAIVTQHLMQKHAASWMAAVKVSRQEKLEAATSSLDEGIVGAIAVEETGEDADDDAGNKQHLSFPDVEENVPYTKPATASAEESGPIPSLTREDSVSAIITRHMLRNHAGSWVGAVTEAVREKKEREKREMGSVDFPDVESHSPYSVPTSPKSNQARDAGEAAVPALQREDTVAAIVAAHLRRHHPQQVGGLPGEGPGAKSMQELQAVAQIHKEKAAASRNSAAEMSRHEAKLHGEGALGTKNPTNVYASHQKLLRPGSADPTRTRGGAAAGLWTMHSAAIIMQCFVRSTFARQRVSEWRNQRSEAQRREAAAIRIQSSERMRRARFERQKILVQAEERKQETKAAVRIQNLARVRQARQLRRQREEEEEKLEKWREQQEAKARLDALKRAELEALRAEFENSLQEEERRKHAALKIQAIARQRAAQKETENRRQKRHTAAIKIQSKVRQEKAQVRVLDRRIREDHQHKEDSLARSVSTLGCCRRTSVVGVGVGCVQPLLFVLLLPTAWVLLVYCTRRVCWA